MLRRRKLMSYALSILLFSSPMPVFWTVRPGIGADRRVEAQATAAFG
ncbi:hypothetical protein [Streptomyces scabiei]|nr:hypothetical protein [Streptomyces scabiei]MDX2531558.1 hypothetical protein [Streptomyces scabiei]MDX2796616.1 hypothetical protein [Streptomyces scabiei]MDX2855852.1 hypothetical protein [Streptomyces scabiei]MDX3824596.1 hypothetical protein [Streptomyces scabiei]